MTRLLGVDPPFGSQPATPQVFNPNLQEIPYQYAQQSSRRLLESNAANASLVSQMAQNLQGVESARAQTEAARAQRTGPGGVSRAFGTIATLGEAAGNILTAVQTSREERRQAELEQLRAIARQSLEIESQELLVNSDAIIRSESGYTGYTRRVHELLAQYQGILEPDEITSYVSNLYAPARNLMSEQARALYGSFNEIADQQIEVSVHQAMFELSGTFARIQNATTPEDARQLSDQAYARILELTVGMQPRAALIVLNTLGEQLLDNYSVNTHHFAELEARLKNLDEYFALTQENINQWLATGDTNAYETNDFLLRQRYGIPSAAPGYNPFAQGEFVLQQLELGNRIRAAQNTGISSFRESMQLETDLVTSIAALLYSSPAERDTLERMFAGMGGFGTAIELSSMMEQARTLERELAIQRGASQLAIDRLVDADDRDLLRWFGSGGGSDILQQLGIAAMFREGLAEYLSALEQPGMSEEQRMEIIRNIRDRRSDMIRTIQQQQQLRETELLDLQARLRPYGLDNPERIGEVLATANTRLSEFQERYRQMEMQYQRDEQGRYMPSPFEIPQLQTITTGAGDSIIPFQVNTAPDVWVSGNLGDPRGGGRLHAGVDLAVPVGTPITFYTGGRVTNVRTQISESGRGYGLYVDVQSPDGYVHRFAHMDQSFVSVGDVVHPGQVIGTAGESGAPGAPHLHWEVRSPGAAEFGFDGAINPLDYTNGLRVTPRLQRNGQGGRPHSVPNGAVLSNGGYIYNNGLHSTGLTQELRYSQSNPYRQSYAPIDRQSYAGQNDGERNFGYAELANDDAFRHALHRSAQRLGIPAQWLADVMAQESGFQANVANRGGSGATGLIQFMPETARALGTTTADLRRMSRAEQMQYVERYFAQTIDMGLVSTPYHLLAAVWGGNGLLQRLANGEDISNVSDGNITWSEYHRRLGRYAGRQYQPLGARPPVHNQYHSNCATCQNLVASRSAIVYHEMQFIS